MNDTLRCFIEPEIESAPPLFDLIRKGGVVLCAHTKPGSSVSSLGGPLTLTLVLRFAPTQEHIIDATTAVVGKDCCAESSAILHFGLSTRGLHTLQ